MHPEQDAALRRRIVTITLRKSMFLAMPCPRHRMGSCHPSAKNHRIQRVIMYKPNMGDNRSRHCSVTLSVHKATQQRQP
ncbi:hypothetical protein DVU_2304 [Nitratidesulfovibrio vulgaris str. Hildenborough]|uniref:Uncharacterized protein n=1 Tax=Nitratidesulfovibrio vulgaris (strain ATCC 29579 / DSM 644 / CCUG 34227 / NCIMB 8303 / VKM B-1760 / Hildenborough) TaxID=882 RepID=Q729P6_NITV2|nr:hypothetical protein DVU_2304 [Nitratidesulfovibrio vulgaris str. Hildenborough]